MFFNFNQLNNQSYFDIVIFGTGFAGLSLALELSKKKKNIALIEAGSEKPQSNSQEEFSGKVIGDPYLKLHECRGRSFGGTSDLWAGWSRQLDEYDFYNKNNFNTGWPITKNSLDPFFDKACDFLSLKTDEKEKLTIKKKLNNELDEIFFAFSRVKRQDGLYHRHFNEVKKDKNISLFLNTNIKKINITSSKIENIEIFSKSNNNVKKIIASNYVLCCGGLENNRILIWQNLLNNNSLIKNKDYLGSYLTEHPHFLTGLVSIENNGFISKLSENSRKALFISPNEKAIKNNNILNSSLRLRLSRIPSLTFRALRKTLEKFKIEHHFNKYVNFHKIYLSDVGCVYEQKPDQNNKIIFDQKNKDSFGVPKINLYFKKNILDYETPKISTMLLKNYFKEKNLGKIKILNWLKEMKNEPKISDQGYYYVGHHIGGTQMSSNSLNGICDENQKVHHLSNLYLSGSSVMPSCGHANPTFTILQLSYRLAEYLKNK